MKKLLDTIGKATPGTRLIAVGNDAYKAFNEYIKTVEEERTKREISNNETRESIAKINAQKDVILESLKGDLELKKSGLNASFYAVERALSNNDHKALELALGSIVEISKTSQIKEIGNLVERLKDPNNIIDI